MFLLIFSVKLRPFHLNYLSFIFTLSSVWYCVKTNGKERNKRPCKIVRSLIMRLRASAGLADYTDLTCHEIISPPDYKTVDGGLLDSPDYIGENSNI